MSTTASSVSKANGNAAAAAGATTSALTESKTAADMPELKLHQLVKTGDVNAVRTYLGNPGAGFNINAVDREGHNALWIAAEALNEPMADLLLAYGATVIQNTQAYVGKNKKDKFVADTALKALKQVQAELKKTPQKIFSSTIQTHTNLFRKFKARFNVEVQPFSSYETGSLEDDGRLLVGIRSKTQLLSGAENSHELRVTDVNGRETIVAYNGRVVSGDSKAKYKLPPLIFFMHHRDDTTFKLIVRNFEFLRRLGYSKLCFETDHDVRLEDIDTENYGRVFSDPAFQREHTAKDIEEIKVHHEFLAQVKTQRHWLKFEGIDMSFGMGARTSATAKAIITTDAITQVRDEFLAPRLVKATDEAQGGTITILGFAHEGVLSHLVAMGSENAFQFQIYHCFSSQHPDEKNEAYRIVRAAAENKGGVGKNDTAHTRFKTTRLDAAVENGIFIMDSTFQANIILAAQTLDPNKVLNAFALEPQYAIVIKSSDLSGKLAALQQLLGLPCDAGIHESGRVDVLLYLKSFEDAKGLNAHIHQKLPLVKPLQFYVSRDSNKGECVAVIPDTNMEKGNEPAIVQALK